MGEPGPRLGPRGPRLVNERETREDRRFEMRPSDHEDLVELNRVLDVLKIQMHRIPGKYRATTSAPVRTDSLLPEGRAEFPTIACHPVLRFGTGPGHWTVPRMHCKTAEAVAA
jgi:hypothetical protein